ncbi:MAG TPA: 4Fe-4S binding protein, partial [Anaerolineaceae bacterium]|nr:4Fe-4S binding protein [Anaerolineaceae bacterium]
CAGCGACAAVCPFGALEIVDGYSVVNEEKCMGCGICVSHCPQGALALELAPQKGAPLEL